MAYGLIPVVKEAVRGHAILRTAIPEQVAQIISRTKEVVSHIGDLVCKSESTERHRHWGSFCMSTRLDGDLVVAYLTLRVLILDHPADQRLCLAKSSARQLERFFVRPRRRSVVV